MAEATSLDATTLWEQLQASMACRLAAIESREQQATQLEEQLSARERDISSRETQVSQRLQDLQADVQLSSKQLLQLRESLLQGLRNAYGERLQLESALAAAGALPAPPPPPPYPSAAAGVHSFLPTPLQTTAPQLGRPMQLQQAGEAQRALPFPSVLDLTVQPASSAHADGDPSRPAPAYRQPSLDSQQCDPTPGAVPGHWGTQRRVQQHRPSKPLPQSAKHKKRKHMQDAGAGGGKSVAGREGGTVGGRQRGARHEHQRGGRAIGVAWGPASKHPASDSDSDGGQGLEDAVRLLHAETVGGQQAQQDGEGCADPTRQYLGRNTDSAQQAERAERCRRRAEAALRADDPHLLELLQKHSLDVSFEVLGGCEGEDEEQGSCLGVEGAGDGPCRVFPDDVSATKREGSVDVGHSFCQGHGTSPEPRHGAERWSRLQAVLDRCMEAASGPGAYRLPFAPPPSAAAHPGPDAAPLERLYCLEALQVLVEKAEAFTRGGRPVRWGWCRPIRAFLFVFEPCNCLVLETPRYGHATWFFELEDPMPVEEQVRRLVAVLSVRGVTKGALLDQGSSQQAQQEGAAARHWLDCVGEEDRALLEACGLSRSGRLSTLVNFSGCRLIHNTLTHPPHQRREDAVGGVEWRERVERELDRCTKGGRIHKEWAR